MTRVLVTGVAALCCLAGASVATADHVHVLVLPGGNCGILAAEGCGTYQILPDVFFANNPNVDADEFGGARTHDRPMVVARLKPAVAV